MIALETATAPAPGGALEDKTHRWQVQTNDELKTAAEYLPVIVHYNNGAAVMVRCSSGRRARMLSTV
jgi:multidrug efflux pump